MSDSEHSSVTYTSVPSPVEDYSDIGSPKVNGPLSPNYVPGPEEPQQAPLSPDYAPPSPVYLPYVPESVYPKYMPPEDDVFPVEEQPLPVVATPTADSPGYILEFDPNGDPKEDEEEDPKEDPADYPAKSTVVALPAVDQVPSEEVTEPLPHIPSPPLPIPSPPPDSPTHIKISESCLPLRKRLHFASPTPSQEVGESSAAGAARQNEPAIARDDPYSLVREELYGFVDRDNPHQILKGKGIIDSGCSRHMTGNKAYLVDYHDFNGGPVAFGGSKGQITSKGKIKTGKLDFEDVYFVKELQHFNLFSVSQMCDKKNKVLFTDTECLVLSPDFKSPDENQVLLRVPRQHNMYCFNLENIIPSGSLAC
nr:ribonuclease H-like domain-containing protein [Tanacetum cinerariifolium]